jgi:hypothetical protein
MAKGIVRATSIDRLQPEPQELDPYERLAAAVLLRALEEVRNARTELPRKLDAVLWLLTPDAEFFAEVAGIAGKPVDLLTSGNFQERSYQWKI